MALTHTRALAAFGAVAALTFSGAVVAHAVPSIGDAAVSTREGVFFDATDANWNTEVLEKSKKSLVVIDFTASWCGACKEMKPIFEKVYKDGKGTWQMGALDADRNRGSMSKYNVKLLPSLVAFGNGVEIGRKDGFVGEESELRTWIKDMLAKAPGGSNPAPSQPGPGQPPAPSQPAPSQPAPSQPVPWPTPTATRPRPTFPGMPGMPGRPVANEPAQGTIPGVDNFFGILKLSGCSGSIVRFPTSQFTDKAMAMTNGHCIGAPTKVGTFWVDKQDNRTMTVLGQTAQQTLGRVTSTRIMYATQSGSDVALLELSDTYEQLRNKLKVDPLLITDKAFQAGDKITITSGGWGKMFKCTIVNPDIYRMKEGDSVWAHSMSYTKETACAPSHGTSGSPMQLNSTGEIQGILNTGSDNGGKCTENNPCEIDQNGKVTVNQNVAYGQRVSWLLTCVDDNRKINLKKSGCMVTGGANPVDLTLPPGAPFN